MDRCRDLISRRAAVRMGGWLALSAAVGLTAACASGGPPATPEKAAPTAIAKAKPAAFPTQNPRVLTMGFPTPTGFFVTDPQARVDEMGRLVASFYSDTLIQSEAGKLVPGLATSWRAIDETTWELTLREGVKFSNGVPLTADTIVYNVQRVLTGIGPAGETSGAPYWNETARQRLREILAPLGDRLGTLAGATTVSPGVVRITTNEPDPILLGRLLELRIVPTDFDRQRVQYQRRTPGTGPYRIDQVGSTDLVTLVANPGSWRGTPKLSMLRVKHAPEVSPRLTALRSGELDLISGVPRTQMDSLKRAGFQVKSVPSTSTLSIFLDTRPGSALADKRLRQALNLAVDKDALVRNVFRGEAAVAQGQVVVDLTTGFNPQLKPYPFDPDQARAILHELGVDRLDEPLKYQLGLPGHQEIADAVAGYWKNAGLQVMTQGVEPRRSFGRPGDDASALGPVHVVTVDPGFALDADLALQYWTGGREGGRWNPPQVDELLSASRRELDPAHRSDLLGQALAIMHDEAPAVFLVQPHEIWAAAKHVTGFDVQVGQLLQVQNLGKG